MSLYNEIYPSVETVLEMEPEEFAPIVLKHLSQAGQGNLNMHNFTTGTSPEFVEWAGKDNLQQRQEVLQRLIVAWRWL